MEADAQLNTFTKCIVVVWTTSSKIKGSPTADRQNKTTSKTSVDHQICPQ